MKKLLILPKIILIILIFAQIGCQGSDTHKVTQDLKESNGNENEIDLIDLSPTSFELKIGEKALINGSTHLMLKEITTKEAVCESFNINIYYSGVDCETDSESEAVILTLTYKGNCTTISEDDCTPDEILQMDIPLIQGEQMDISSGDSSLKIILKSTTQNSAAFDVF